MKIVLLWIALCALSCKPAADSSAKSIDINNRASFLYYFCRTHLVAGDGKKYEYVTSQYFNNDSVKDPSNSKIAMSLRIEGIPREGFEVAKVGNSRWEVKNEYTLELGVKENGEKGIRVYDHKRNHEAGYANSSCKSKNLFPGCSKHTWDIDTDCIATGETLEDATGDALISIFLTAGMQTGVSLVRKGVLRLVTKGTWSGGKFALAATQLDDPVALGAQSKVSNRAVARALEDVDDEIVEFLEIIAKNSENTPMPLSSMGEILDRKIKSISIGTARKFTEKTGREIALVRNTVHPSKPHYWVIGGKNSASVEVPIGVVGGKSEFRLIYHIHPDSPNVFLPELASKQDFDFLIMAGQKKSFIASVGRDFLTMYATP